MFKRISVEQTRALLEQQQVNLVDIRDPQSFALGHMQGAVNINNQNISDYIAESNKKTPLIVVCYHGHSSQPVAQYFVSQEFDEVYSMDGGFEVWKLNNPIAR